MGEGGISGAAPLWQAVNIELSVNNPVVFPETALQRERGETLNKITEPQHVPSASRSHTYIGISEYENIIMNSRAKHVHQLRYMDTNTLQAKTLNKDKAMVQNQLHNLEHKIMTIIFPPLLAKTEMVSDN